MPALHRVLADQGQVVALVKPQFEAGREQIGKNGIIRDAKIHQNVLESVTNLLIFSSLSFLFIFKLTMRPLYCFFNLSKNLIAC
ncbi:hemolysin A [Streptococcus pneumoniae]|nr:hemolysin A [Streptococcus pneumoniae]